MGSSSGLHLGSEAQSQASLQLKLQELVEDEQLIDITQFQSEEEYQTLFDSSHDCEERGWKTFLQTGQQVHQMSKSISSTEESELARELRDIELIKSAQRAERMLEERLSKTQALAETGKKKHKKNNQENDQFKEQMHNQIQKLNGILDQIEGEAKTYAKYIQGDTQDTPGVTLEVKQKRVLHIVPHSHTDDLSSNKKIQMQLSEMSSDSDLYDKGTPSGFIGSVEDILNSTMLELYADGNKTFTFGDLKYFKQWYETLNETDQADVKTVVQNGQLDLVNGAYMPPDEALTQYDSLLDSFQLGQQFLWKEFEYQPRVSWQLDVNGVSQGYARLAKDVGFDMLIFSSVSPAEKELMRKKGKHLQIWRTAAKNFGKRKDVLAVTLDQGQSALNSYCWPKGFWADTNYMIDQHIALNKNQSDYNFDDLVKSLYADITDRFDKENSTHLFQPFGCDMAFVDAKVNYQIMDKLITMWKELGFDKDVEIKYSSPSIFYQAIHQQNDQYIAEALVQKNATANATANDTKNATENGWSIRRDDTFPYQPTKTTFLSGYYSARPHLKKRVREFTQSFHSSLRLVSQQVLRKDLSRNETGKILQFQTNIMESLGNLQSYEAITGTSNQFLSGEYYDDAETGKREVLQMNSKLLMERIYNEYGIKVNKLDSDMKFKFNGDELESTYSHDNNTLIVVQNPSQQKREQIVEIQVPYYNFTVSQIVNNSKRIDIKVEKFMPRVWQNSQKFTVPSIAQFKVTFDNPNELYKIFVIKGQGIIRKKNPVPANYQFKYMPEPKIWNLNLPVFLPRNGWEISNYQQDFITLLPNATITAGSKSLKFLQIVPKKKLKKGKSKKGGKSSEGSEKSEGSKSSAAGASEDVMKEQSKSATKGKNEELNEAKPSDSANSTAPLDPIADAQNSTSNMSQQNGTDSASKQKKKKKTKVKSLDDENEGAAVFLYEDSATGVKQKFAFSLRYYVGENAVGEPLKKSNSTGLIQLDRRIESGVYNFDPKSVAALGPSQKSYRYGEVNLKRSKKKANNDSAEFLLVYEQQYAAPSKPEKEETKKNEKVRPADKFKEEEYKQKIRAHVRINLNKIDEFVKFHVSTNEVPITQDKTGKDVVVDWFLMDGFDTDDKFWVDTNGLQMVPKTLNYRKEYNFNQLETISGNYYPITSAIAVRDFNKSMNSDLSQRQVTVMTDRSQGASAGMRSRKNIEIMHQRRYRKSNFSKSTGDGLNDRDANGRGVQVKETYYMQVSTVGKSKQRMLQKQIDQPLLIMYSQGYQVPKDGGFDSSKSTSSPMSLVVMEKVTKQMKDSFKNTTTDEEKDREEKKAKLLKGGASASSGAPANTGESSSSTQTKDLGTSPGKAAKENFKKETAEDKQERLLKQAKETDKEFKAKLSKEEADQEARYCSGQGGDEFKGRIEDHNNGKIPAKICEHYATPDRAKTADEAKKLKPKPKDNDKEKKEGKKKEPTSYDNPAPPTFAQSPTDADVELLQLDVAANDTDVPEESKIQIEDINEDTFTNKSKVWYNKYNKQFKETSTLKLIPFGVQKNQVMIRLANLEDNFDGMTAKTYKFDINAWAREFYLEANSHYLMTNTTTELLQGIRLNITEMNLAGSVSKSYFENKTLSHTKWLQLGESVESLDSPIKTEFNMTKLDKEPKDNIQFVEIERAKGSVESLGTLYEQNFIVNLEPQAIRMFSIQYFMPNLYV